MTVPTPDRPFRLGTRASPLAMRQAELTRAALCAAHALMPDAVVLVPMVATGDRIQDRPLAEIGGKALWTRELDRALADGIIDAAVHSMKDVETLRPDVFAIAAMLPRADVRDRLIGAASIADLPMGARVGTSSPRRSAQLLHLRPDLQLTLLRGNVGTRLGKVADRTIDATLLAAAGLDRLGMDDVGHAVPIDTVLPAPQQGAIGIEVHSGNDAARGIVAAIGDGPTMRAVACERALLRALGGDCQSPIAALAVIDADGALTLHAQIFSRDGRTRCHASATAPVAATADDDAVMAATLAAGLLADAPDDVRALFATQ